MRLREPSRIRTLADAQAVAGDCKATKAELRWALRAAVALAESAERRLSVGEPIIGAIEEIALGVADSLIADRTGA